MRYSYSVMTNVSKEHAEPISISVRQFWRQFGEVLARVQDQFEQYQVIHQGKSVARIVNHNYLQAVEELLRAEPGLADTVALMLNDEAQAIIGRSEREVERGQIIPLVQAMGTPIRHPSRKT